MSGRWLGVRADPAHPDEINFGWLIRLRWSMVTGQLLTILGVRFLLGLALPLGALLALVAVEAASNVAAALLGNRRPVRQGWMAALMGLDVVMCTGLLFFWHRALPVSGSHEGYMELHLRGMWVAFGVAAGFIVYFLLRVRRALAQREIELARSRVVAARQERLASLATLAAGAAHELSTPLGTIAVIMTELQRRASLVNAGATVTDDLSLVRQQVDRCRAILERMSSDAGETIGEGTVATPVAALLTEVLGELLRSTVPVRAAYADGEATLRVRVPRRAFAQALRGIVKNAQEASPPGGAVDLRVRGERGAALVFEVRDDGPGIPGAVIERVGEPFFTTKPPGAGMGLGVFLARTTIERLGGKLRLESSEGGTTARLELPGALIEPAGGPAA